MAKREEKGSAGSFSRGAELWMHQARLFVVAIWTVVLISILAGLAVTTAYFWNATTADEKYALERNVLAHTRDALYMTAGKMELNVNGELRKMEVSEVALLTDDMAEDAWRKLRNGGMFGLLTSIGVVFLISLYWWGYGRERMQDNQLRGAKLVEGKELARLIRHRDEASPYEIAGVPMRVKSETLHTLFAGAQGTGKSQQFFALMKQVRARGKRMIVYDPTGEFTQAFYREGKDILMNPLDSRSPNWNIWNEIAKDYHFDNMANGLIPDPAESDPFWALAGRMVLKDVIAVLGREGRRTNRDLYNAIAKSNLDAMHALLQGTAGATYVDPTTERTGMSLKMTVQNQLEAFRFLPDEGESFSIRKWVHEEGDSWMFITAREAMREALKPVLSLWIDTAIKAVLDLEPIHRERLWFCIDELPTLQKLDILKLALTNTRKYGLCMVLGVQDFSQLYEIYGHDLAKTIISGCQTKLLLRVTDGAAAKLLAELMGQAEVDEKDETLSYGLSSQRDGVSVMARRQMRDLVLTSEILTLPDMTGYLLVPGDYPIARVKYGYVPTEKQANGFIERDGFAISFKPTTAAAAPAPAPAAAEVQQPSVPEQGDMLDDDDMDAPATVEVMRNENGDVIDKATGEIIKPAEKVSRAKDDADAKSAGQGKKPNPLADAL
ncbi:type VI secretion protein (plasmid) [Acidovorax carolinensis]|uniref:Type VI secretion protein n=1 Tax=Acidovorax carolinensis TaxID=553814 RepID=A0A240UKP4_9BURK|nr:type IV secretion system DNA-binding domain-containing protein [Acidovorax carolinensis]ART57385.1 type VI secretion protein [Acidovorax carolinensis]ART61612.1 type VI secretion protein [Acidovorax carolinensis]MDN8056846.1 type IV secretion system DNA-binding domain-containing protein [Burkholderia multivorans]